MENTFYRLPRAKIITFIDSSSPVGARNPLMDYTTKNALIRPSRDETNILDRSWGGVFNYNHDNGKTGIQHDCPTSKVFRMDNMSFIGGINHEALAIARLEIIDNKGRLIVPDITRVRGTLNGYPVSNMYNGSTGSFWHNHGGPSHSDIFLQLEFNTEVSISSISITSRSTYADRTFLDCRFSVKESSGSFKTIPKYHKSKNWGKKWEGVESRTAVFTNFKSW